MAGITAMAAKGPATTIRSQLDERSHNEAAVLSVWLRKGRRENKTNVW